MNSKILPGLALLQEYINYDKFNGKLYWKKAICNRVKIGDEIGNKDGHGHLFFSFRNQRLKVHRVIWKIHTWQEPENEIDHINTIRDDNRFINLRPASRQENLANSSLSKSNKSGFKGVSYHQKSGKWRARIMINYIDKTIGYFDSIEEAAICRKKFAINLHGEYARESYEF